MTVERIAKYLSHAGVSSRREAEKLIREGRVTVNGETLETPAYRVDRDSIVAVDGTVVEEPLPLRVWRFHKPAGTVVTHRDDKGRTTIFDILPDGLPRVITVGRLDYNTEGLLLLTTNGDLARWLELPSTGWVREYRARVFGNVTENKLTRLQRGMVVDGFRYAPVNASIDTQSRSNTWLSISMTEGKNREIRRLLSGLQLETNRLIRTAFGPFVLGELGAGDLREIRRDTLRDKLGERWSKRSGADHRWTKQAT